MAFANIKNIRNASAKSQYYFFDTNTWIYVFEKSGTTDTNYKYKPYVDFFNKVIDSTIDPLPKIIVNSLFLSELTNTYMRTIGLTHFLFEKYGTDKPPEKFNYKNDFRPTDSFQEQYRFILDEIKSYKKYWFPIDDKFNELQPEQLLTKCPNNLDFNDYYYYELCKLSSKDKIISIVTHDGDFKFEDIEIITMNKRLLDLYKPDLKPQLPKV